MLSQLGTIPFEKKSVILTRPLPARNFIAGKTSFFILKRLSDVLISTFVVVILLVFLFPILAFLIKLESRGPVFFIQRRVGKGGKSFRCFKFRTMVVNNRSHTAQAVEGDTRITRVGAFLRKSNLDELPQFINVLMGDMSIVGPRPHMYTDCARFSSVIRGYKFRNVVKPGITGLAQSKGLRGPTHDFTSMFHRYQLDAFYIRNASFYMDVRIVMQTASQTFKTLQTHFNAFFTIRMIQYKKVLALLL